ncbi:hypothetical protein CASFOL_006772 [Castilleja foliolosa]|uniref:Sulfotransferase n=1 Tax=Castilleja foliolosa TaxID=1961234 RepID=A0ABD3E896_9LAMI
MSTNTSNLSSSSTSISTPNNVKKLLNELPKARFYDALDLYMWEGLWIVPDIMVAAIAFRSSFEARDDDILLASTAKTASPHFHLPTIEAINYFTNPPPFDIYDASAPRFLHTHLPYSVLPDSVKNSACKIVYICRNPKDTLISMWYFCNSLYRPNQEAFPLEKLLDCFCSGVQLYGSFFDHVLEYWVESKKRPDKILFVRYEELKSDPKGHVSRIARFLGRPLVDENEVDEVLWRSSLNRLKNLDVNNSGNMFTIEVKNVSINVKQNILQESLDN